MDQRCLTTCPEAQPFCCCVCGIELSGDEMVLEADPYASEINNDERLHLQCQGCKHEAAMDI